MKLVVVIAICQVATVLAQSQRQQQYFQNEQGSIRKQQPLDDQRPSSSQDRYTTPVPIIRFNKEQSADGSYKTSYETGNNIIAEETGFLKNPGIENEEALVQHGSYSYTAPDGSIITVTYTADEQGFRAEGAHLPTPPPIPAEIQKSLDIIYEQIRLQQEQEARENKFQKPEETNFAGEENYPSRFRQ
ncbi:endocuticle structural glycoprotein SgAbd-8-like [Cryptotermes secundus]|uniref:endocuticle structural glycoprotein SgAbd-8-like n=1 Tax=Cryptotermes secundus TaxID=105785 RepID=UPI000CD7D9E5|nr:endocuticle structural glycoprotein SgAbd-8-like [Cryptotermes secundus]